MKKYLIIATVFVAAVLSGCKGKQNAEGELPDGFKALPDSAKVAYVMKNATPDSVARFICRAALGQVPGASIDNLGLATTYAYDKYTGEDFNSFSDEYDNYVASLTLPDKMKMYALAGVEDPQGLGLQLGLEYMQSIREKNLSVADVEKELKAFKKACGKDTDTYNRFLIGFKTVLKADRNNDMPKGIYERFINYE
jgi:hypothetical protein